MVQGDDFRGPDCDQSVDAVLAVAPEISRAVLHKHSYAALLYEEVRSAYAHQYGPGDRATSWPMARTGTPAVSYANRIDEDSPYLMRRLIHFHTKWLIDLVLDLASELDAASKLPFDRPTAWWLDLTSAA